MEAGSTTVYVYVLDLHMYKAHVHVHVVSARALFTVAQLKMVPSL